jgi:hypothetical protein
VQKCLTTLYVSLRSWATLSLSTTKTRNLGHDAMFHFSLLISIHTKYSQNKRAIQARNLHASQNVIFSQIIFLCLLIIHPATPLYMHLRTMRPPPSPETSHAPLVVRSSDIDRLRNDLGLRDGDALAAWNAGRALCRLGCGGRSSDS